MIRPRLQALGGGGRGDPPPVDNNNNQNQIPALVESPISGSGAEAVATLMGYLKDGTRRKITFGPMSDLQLTENLKIIADKEIIYQGAPGSNPCKIVTSYTPPFDPAQNCAIIINANVILTNCEIEVDNEVPVFVEGAYMSDAPLQIAAGKDLTIGAGSIIKFTDISPNTTSRTGGRIFIEEGGELRGNISTTGGVWKNNVEKVVFKYGSKGFYLPPPSNPSFSQMIGNYNIGVNFPPIQIETGSSFTLKPKGFEINGKIHLKYHYAVRANESLIVWDDSKLIVENSAVLSLSNDIEQVYLNGPIDLKTGTKLRLQEEDVIAKFKTQKASYDTSYVTISSATGEVETGDMPAPLPSSPPSGGTPLIKNGGTPPLNLNGTANKVLLGNGGLTIISSISPPTNPPVKLDDDLPLAAGIIKVGSGNRFDISTSGKTLTISGTARLENSGTINVTAGGILVRDTYSSQKGTIANSGTINVNDSGVIQDNTLEWTSPPSGFWPNGYGAGSIIITGGGTTAAEFSNGAIIGDSSAKLDLKDGTFTITESGYTYSQKSGGSGPAEIKTNINILGDLDVYNHRRSFTIEKYSTLKVVNSATFTTGNEDYFKGSNEVEGSSKITIASGSNVKINGEDHTAIGDLAWKRVNEKWKWDY